MSAAVTQNELVIVVDNDVTTSRRIRHHVEASGGSCRSFKSSVELLDWIDYNRLPDRARIVAETDLRDLGGLDLLKIFRADDVFVPVVLMGARLSVGEAVEAMYAGAVYILKKPFGDDALAKALARRIGAVQLQPDTEPTTIAMSRRLASLTPRQREILQHVFEGRTNRDIANVLSISPKTVELHRAAMMQRMGVQSLTELIRLASRCDALLYRQVDDACA